MISRRHFLVTGSVSAAGAALAPVLRAAQKPLDLSDWRAVREQFDLDSRFIHLGLFYIASHPRPVRAAIDEYRKRLDANPFETVEHSLFTDPAANLTEKTSNAIASYIGGKPAEIALTQNTTTGLSLLYNGFPLKPGDEILTTEHDHYVHHEAIRMAAERAGATSRRIALFDSYDSVDADQIVDRIRKAIRPNTRIVGVTWVHSSSGVKLPIARIAAAVAEVNRNRADRVWLFVDGVHGIGVEGPAIASTGIDAFSAGMHKWIFGPRGTGFLWAKPEVWATLKPTSPSFSSFEVFEAWMNGAAPKGAPNGSWFSPGGFQAYEHFWALPAAIDFHRAIGSPRITKRIHELNAQMKEGLAAMSHVKLYTPRSEDLSSGIVCFDVNGLTQAQTVGKLHEKGIIASTTPYKLSYARVACGIMNTANEVDTTLKAVRSLV